MNEITQSLSLPRIGAPYVERSEPRESEFDRQFHHYAGRLVPAMAVWRRREARRIASRAEEHSDRIAALGETPLAAEIAELRTGILRRGLKTTEERAWALALMREAAYRSIDLRPHPVQLIGAAILLGGALAEMETGEGKTLTALMPAALLAMTGQPVHVITANDYLAGRDAEFAQPFFARLGLTVGAVRDGMVPDERRKAYRASVTYGAGKEVAFDYLRDRMALGTAGPKRLRLEALKGGQRRTDKLVMRGLGAVIVDEADSIMVDEARTPLILTRAQEGEIGSDLCTQALEAVSALEEERHFTLDRKRHRIELTDEGEAELAARTDGLGAPWDRELHRHDLATKALTALHIFKRDEHYLLKEGKVSIIDEYTGRLMPDRFWNDGLHQMIEVKEGCGASGLRLPMIKITYQRFFRRYRHLSGMSGTLRETAAEIWSVYRVAVIRVPTHQPLQRKALPRRIFATAEAKWEWIAERASSLSQAGRPVLIGVRTVDSAQEAASALAAKGVEAQVLSAAQDEAEADIVARAGEGAQITVATNMAGRGTDIRLNKTVEAKGGLHVIIAERHQSRRIDRQLAGRCARQGEKGSYEICGSLDDGFVHPLANWVPVERGGAFARLGIFFVDSGQRRLERVHGKARAELLRQDIESDGLMGFAGQEI